MPGDNNGNKPGLGNIGKPASESKANAPATDANQNPAATGLPQPAEESKPTVVGASESIVEKQQAADDNSEQTNEQANDAAEAAKDQLAEGGIEAYGKNTSQDENNPLTSPEQLEAIQRGSEILSGQRGATNERLANIQAAGRLARSELAGIAENEEQVTYSSHPILNYKLGRFQFVKGVLKLDAEDAAAFDELLEKQPPREKARVKKIDRDAAERVAKRYLDQATIRTRGVDTAGARSNLRGNN